MKILFATLLLLLAIPLTFASTERVDLMIGQSFEFDGRNITLVNIDFDNDKAIVCMNNKKIIIEEDKEKNIDSMGIEMTQLSSIDVELKLSYSCKNDCRCDSFSCSNIDCFPQPSPIELFQEQQNEEETQNIEPPEPEVIDEIDESETQEEITETTTTTTSKKSFDIKAFQQVSIGLIVIVVILGIVFFIRKKD